MSFKIIPVTVISNIKASAKVAFFNTKSYDKKSFLEKNKDFNFEIKYFEEKLNAQSSKLAKGYEVVCAFVNDTLDRETLKNLANLGVEILALRCAGFDNVDLDAAHDYRITVLRVPEYSSHSIAEHAFALLLSLVRKINLSSKQTKDYNFRLEGLMGFDLYQKTVGIIGTGKIGKVFIEICNGFGMKIVAYDPYPDHEFAKKIGFEYVDLDYLYANSDIISLHCPSSKENQFMINSDSMQKMKTGVIVINTSRGLLVQTQDLIQNLKAGKIGGAGLDVYQNEKPYFFEDLSKENMQDDILARLLTFKNVIVTPHQAFFTKEALDNIATITLSNIQDYFEGKKLVNEVTT